jgi:hypothetical protein
MPISFNSGGSGLPYIRFSPSVNAWTFKADGGALEFDPTKGPIAFDVERMTMGWLTIGEGSRDWQPWTSFSARTKSPGGEARPGFLMHCYAPKLFGSEQVYEFSSNATASTRFAEMLFNLTEKEHGKGKVPLVQITGAKAIKIGKGTTREIQFEVARWIDRPAKLDEVATAAVEEEAPVSAAPKQSAFADAEF